MLFLKQYRFPTGAYSWELPMGGIDHGEQPISAAMRELEEETRMKMDLKEIGIFHPIPGLTPQKVYVFQGSLPDSEKAKFSMSDDLTDEIVQRKFLCRNEIVGMIASGEISDGFTLCSLALMTWR